MTQQDAVEVDEPHRPPVPSPRPHGQSTDTIPSTSFRAHPYSRRPSLPTSDSEHTSRIHLPRPNIGGQLRSEVPRQTPTQSNPINIPSISSLVSGPSSWRREQERERYWDDRAIKGDIQNEIRPRVGRSVSGETTHSSRPSLPPLHMLGVSEPTSNTPTPTSVHTPLSLPQPSQHRTNPPSPHFAYSRPSSPPPPPSGHPSTRQLHQHPLDNRHYSSNRSASGVHSQYRDTSPPLRAVPGGYDAPPMHHSHRFQDPYHPDPSAYRGPPGHRIHPQMHVDPYTGRPLGPSGPGQGPTMRRHDEERHAGPSAQAPGQSRRLAHLMSEQKRRESINTGFQALRKVVPAASPTDSKAVILRKAAAHIAHLEGLLNSGSARSRLTDRAFEMDERMGSGSDDGVDVDDDEEGSDVDRDHTVVKVEETTSTQRW